MIPPNVQSARWDRASGERSASSVQTLDRRDQLAVDKSGTIVEACRPHEWCPVDAHAELQGARQGDRRVERIGGQLGSQHPQPSAVAMNDRILGPQRERRLVELDLGQHPDECVVPHHRAGGGHQGSGRECIGYEGIAAAVEHVPAQFTLGAEVSVNLCVVDAGCLRDAPTRYCRGWLGREQFGSGLHQSDCGMRSRCTAVIGPHRSHTANLRSEDQHLLQGELTCVSTPCNRRPTTDSRSNR